MSSISASSVQMSPNITAQNDGISNSTDAQNFANARAQNDIDSADTDNDAAHAKGEESNAQYQENKISDDEARLKNDSKNGTVMSKQTQADIKELKSDIAAAPGMGVPSGPHLATDLPTGPAVGNTSQTMMSQTHSG